MRREHFPRDPKYFRQIEYTAHARLDPPHATLTRPRMFDIKSAASVMLEVEELDKSEQGIFNRIDGIKNEVDEVLKLSENDVENFVFNGVKPNMEQWTSGLSSDSRIQEKLEKEKTKRRFCEGKIIDLQKEIIALEESNYVLKENCAKKNIFLNDVHETLLQNRTELVNFCNKKNFEMKKVKNAARELDDQLQNKNVLNAQLGEKNKTLLEQVNELNHVRIELERQVLYLSEEKETISDNYEELTKCKNILELEYSKSRTDYEEKVSVIKKALDNDRAKLAKFEKEENNAVAKSKMLQQSLDLMRLQMEQSKGIRESQQKQIIIEKNNVQKKTTELDEKTNEFFEHEKRKDLEIHGLNGAKLSLQNDIKVLQDELEAVKISREHERSHFLNEKQKQESYHRSLQSAKLEEHEAKFCHKIAKLIDTHQDEKSALTRKIEETEEETQRKLDEQEKVLKNEYQHKMKGFLQQHYNQGLNALSSSVTRRRSSSPKNINYECQTAEIENICPAAISPIQFIQPRPPPPKPQQPLSQKSKRERDLRKMIETMLSQTPLSEQDKSECRSDNGSGVNMFHNRISQLVQDHSLTDREKKNLQKLASLMK